MSGLPMPSAADAVPEVLSRYAGLGGSEFVLHRTDTMNETYRVRGDGDDRYVLKIYRSGWRSTAEVGAETAALLQLRGRGAQVAVPIADVEGRLHSQVVRPEGLRPYMLARDLGGVVPGFDTKIAPIFGAAAARLHTAGETIGPIASLRTLGLEFLLAESMRVIRPWIEHHRDGATVLALGERLAAQLDQLAPELSWVFCHGDLHGGNARMVGDSVWFFDFEFCGPGFLAYDLAVYRWVLEVHAPDRADSLWDAFCRAYDKVRPLRDVDREATAPFVLVRHLFNLAIEAQIADGPNKGLFEPSTLDRYLGHLPDWDARFC